MTLLEPGRLTAEARREAILVAAAEVFGRRGYIGATTDQIAKAAGISQPYVVRLFGTKEALFLAVIRSAKDALLAAFQEELVRARAAGGGPAEIAAALGERYIALSRERGLHLSLMQAFLQGADPAVGDAARAGYLEIWRFVRDEAGLGVLGARDFLAHGMLISVLLGVEMPAITPSDPDARELVEAACGGDPSMLETGFFRS